MGYSDELYKLVLQNMEIVHEAPKVIEELDNELVVAFRDILEQTFKEKQGWQFDFDYEEGEYWIAPQEWLDEDGNRMAHYSLDWLGEEDMEWVKLATFNESSLILMFTFEKDKFNMNVKMLQAKLESFYSSNKILQDANFVYNNKKKGILLSFKLNPKELAEEYPNFDNSLVPFKNTLEEILKVNGEFEKFVNSLK